MSTSRLDDILRHLQPPPGVKLWHGGATVLGCLRGVTAAVAAWEPAPGRHGIWGLTLHVAYWKYAVRRRITGEERGGFRRSPSNFPDLPEERTDGAWKKDRTLLRQTHLALVDSIASFDPARLDEIAGDGTTTWVDVFWGIVLHDVHHVGQIQILKRLCPEA